ENGVTYTASDSPVVLDLSDDNGCAYTATLVINESNATSDIYEEVSVCAGSDYTWSQNGETYTAADSPVVLTIDDNNGCSYTATLTITEYEAPENTVTEVTVCEGSDYTWSENGVTYAAADSPIVLDLSNDNGCAYTSTLIINEGGNTASDVYEQVTVCYGGDYTWALSGATYTAADSPVVLELTTDSGCPYTATLTIIENEPVCDSVTEVSICDGATYTWDQDGESYTVADSPVVLHLTDLNGYDYTAVLIIYSNDVAEDVVDEVVVCAGGEYTWGQNGETYTAADSPVVLTIDDNGGCSYTATLMVTEYEAQENAVTEVTVCAGADYTWSESGLTYTAVDSPVVLDLTDANGCAFTSTLIINESNATSDIYQEVSVCAGSDYTWDQNGETYSVADSPVVLTIDDNSGCSYTSTLVITEYNTTDDVVTEVIVCEGTDYLWSENDELYSAADSPVVLELTDVNGCSYTSTLIITEHVPVNTIVTEVTVCSGEEYVWSQDNVAYTAADSPVVLNLTNVNGCAYTATLTITEFVPTEDIVTEVTICEDETYIWSYNDEAYTTADSPVVIELMDNNGCTYTTSLIINEESNVVIGDYVWLDENENGIQDDGVDSGINGVTATLYSCNENAEVDSTVTANNPADGQPGYYMFEVCANSGEYYIVFSNTPDGYEFSMSNSGSESSDSNANSDGVTTCFDVTTADVTSIDAGLFNSCHLEVDAGADAEVCANETVTLSASFSDVDSLCHGGCDYPILNQDRCDGPSGDFEVWVVSSPVTGSFQFNASQQSFETFDNGTAKYTATVSNGVDVLLIDFTYSGYTTATPQGSPKLNDCQTYDTSGYEYYTQLTGFIKSQNHGVFTVTPMGEAFQIGMGADVKRLGFGASGWYTLSGGDGTYTNGDLNLALGACQPKAVDYQWTTQDGSIVGSSTLETITVDQAGTYTVQAVNCVGCVATDSVVVTESSVCNGSDSSDHSLRVYPVPASSNTSVTIDVDIDGLDGDSNLSNIEVSVYDARGRLVHQPKTYQVIAGRNLIEYELGNIDLGTYLMKVTGEGWLDTSRLIIK
uniref:SdrD B-like domain-containing protein n=1 Tax=uncultured Winogradskyella sp. TaxID=395353 RepID=UPI00261FAC66